MTTDTRQHDVFLSYSVADKGVADAVVAGLTAAGIDVWSGAAGVIPGDKSHQTMMTVMAESGAFVAVMRPEAPSPPRIVVEVGAALAWHKPVYVVSTDERSLSPPSYAPDAPVFSPSRIDELASALKQKLRPLSDAERGLLANVYAGLGIPTDRLVQQPAALDRLADAYNRETAQHIPGERLVQELIRMRKQGRLPTPRKRTRLLRRAPAER